MFTHLNVKSSSPSSARGWSGSSILVPAVYLTDNCSTILLIGHTHFDRLGSESSFSGHMSKGMLLFTFGSESYESITFAETSIVQNNLCTADSLVTLGEEAVQCKVVDFWGQISHPDGGVGFSRLKTSAVVVQFETDRRVAIRNHFSSQAMHRQNGTMVAVKVDEAITSGLTRELICHHFYGDDAILPELDHGLPQECLVHVRLEAPDPKSAWRTKFWVNEETAQFSCYVIINAFRIRELFIFPLDLQATIELKAYKVWFCETISWLGSII